VHLAKLKTLIIVSELCLVDRFHWSSSSRYCWDWNAALSISAIDRSAS